IELVDVVWLAPLMVTEQTPVFIALFPAEAAEQGVAFEIFSAAPGAERDDIVHCRGRARLLESGAPVALDVGTIRKSMGRGRVEAAEVYAAYREMGMQFGP